MISCSKPIVETMRAALTDYDRQDNTQAFARLDELLDQCAADLL